MSWKGMVRVIWVMTHRPASVLLPSRPACFQRLALLTVQEASRASASCGHLGVWLASFPSFVLLECLFEQNASLGVKDDNALWLHKPWRSHASLVLQAPQRTLDALHHAVFFERPLVEHRDDIAARWTHARISPPLDIEQREPFARL